jgi:hypothetical protein
VGSRTGGKGQRSNIKKNDILEKCKKRTENELWQKIFSRKISEIYQHVKKAEK